MFKLSFNTAILPVLAAAVVATGISTSPSFAGEGGGGGGKEISSNSSPNPDKSKASVRSKKGFKTYTVTRTKNGKVINKKKVNKKPKIFVTRHFDDGTERTIFEPTDPGGAFIEIKNDDGTTTRVDTPRARGGDFVTRHYPNGEDVTITEPSKPGRAFISIRNADGSTTTARADR